MTELIIIAGGVAGLTIWGCMMYQILPSGLPDIEDQEIEKDDTESSRKKRAGRVPLPRGYVYCIQIFLNAAVAAMLALYYHRDPDDILLTVGTISFLWPCAYMDRRVQLIPNRILLYAIIVRAVWFAIEAFLFPGLIFIILLSSVIAAFALMAASLLCKVVSPGSVGMGDVKLLGVTGLFLAMDKVWGAVFAGLIIMFCVCVFLLVTKRAARSSRIAFAPFLLAGTVLGAILMGI